MRNPHILKSCLLLAALVAAGGASAQTKTWTFNDTSAPATCAGSNANGAVIACQTQPNGTTTTLEVSAWSATSSVNYASASVTPQGGDGFGVGNATEGYGGASSSNGNHAVDNANDAGIDALLLKFTGGAEALTQVKVGWSGSADGDFQVLRWTGSSAPASNFLTGKNANNLVSAGGWELVALINGTANINPDATFNNFNNNGLTSSYWMLSAYNSNITATATGTNSGTATNGVDALKFLGVGTTSSSQGGRVPEPASLALVGIALIGSIAARRRQQAAA